MSELPICGRPGSLSKKAFASPAKARKAARDSHVKLFVYRCHRCAYWHVTKRPRNGGGR